ncbi:hypothetical protein JCM10207_009022 [Rhodosporidiobolus poonsookiae]
MWPSVLTPVPHAVSPNDIEAEILAKVAEWDAAGVRRSSPTTGSAPVPAQRAQSIYLSSSPATPTYFPPSPLDAYPFASSTPMSVQSSTCSTAEAATAPSSVAAPSAVLSSSSRPVAPKSPLIAAFPHPEALDSAIAVLKTSPPKRKRSHNKSTRLAPLRHSLPSAYLPPPRASPSAAYGPVSSPPPTLSRSCSEPVIDFGRLLASADASESQPLFRPESPPPAYLPCTPITPEPSPSASAAPPSPLYSSAADLRPVGDESPFSASKSHKARAKAKKAAEGHIPRPANAWLLYRSARAKEFAERQRQGGPAVPLQAELSKIIGEMWRSEPLDVREHFARQALDEAEEHRRRFPDYTYRPKHSRKAARSRSDDVHRPLLRKSHTVASGEQLLLPAVEIAASTSDMSVDALYASGIPVPSSSASSTFDFSPGPPTSAASEAWTTFQSTPSTWFDASALQLDMGECPVPASAPATMSAFDLGFSLPAQPLVGAFSTPLTSPAVTAQDIPIPAGLAALTLSPQSESVRAFQPSYDDLVSTLALNSAPPTAGASPSFGASAYLSPALSSNGFDAAGPPVVYGTATSPAVPSPPEMTPEEIEAFLEQLSHASSAAPL